VNLLYTITAYPPSVGGAQAHFHELARRLVQRHQLRVLAHWAETRTDWLLGTTLRSASAAPGRTEEGYILDGVPVHLLSLTPKERLLAAPHVLGYYLIKGSAISHLSDLVLRHLEPYAGGVDLVHNGRIGREGLSFASLKLARRLDVPFVLTPFHHPRWVGWNYQHYTRLYREADGVIALTEVEREALIRLGVAPSRVFVTGMGPILAGSADAGSFRQQHHIAGPLVLFLGQKYRYKGCAELLQAAPLVWTRFPEATFLFLGPRTHYSRALFRHHADLRIVELGIVDLATKTDALAACDLLCLPSTQESFGAVFAEAWMLGKPVIGGDSPAAREVIHEGVDGYVVEQQPAAIAERILYLLEHPAACRQLGERGRAKTLSLYTWERLVEQTESVYRTLLR
jgi:glycosyltransferase involved in cell wall biosynthesis